MYWTVCSTDDCVHPERTQIFVDYLQENPGISMVVSDMGMIDDAGRELHLNNTSSFVRNRTLLHPNFSIDTFGTYQSLLFDNYIPGSLMIARQVFEEVGLFNESIQMEDWDMWLRISLKYKIGFINRILAYYRWHDTNAVKLTPVKMRKSMFTTFFNQKKICYTGNKKELFENAYVHHFINYYNPVKYPATSVSFHQIRLPVYVKALRTKIIKMTKALFTQKN